MVMYISKAYNNYVQSWGMNSLAMHSKIIKLKINTELRPYAKQRKIHNNIHIGTNLKIHIKPCGGVWLENIFLDKEDPWVRILAATKFAVLRSYHATSQSTPGKMVFGCDMILNTPLVADWEAIRRHKQELIDKNNQKKN